MMDRATLCILVSLFLFGIHSASSFIAYDCAAPSMNYTTLSLLNIKDCDIPIVKPNVTKTKIQLLQSIETTQIHVIQCKIRIVRTIYYCGHASHISTVTSGHAEYIDEISRDACQDIMTMKTYRTYDTTIKDIQPNSTTSRHITFAGSVDSDGNCQQAKFSDHYGSWSKVVVQGQIFITVQDYFTSVNLLKNQLILRSGVRCGYSSGNCMDNEGGNTYWNLIETDQCKFHRFQVIYEGPADHIKDSSAKKLNGEIYSVSANEITFALSVKGFIPVCGYKVIRTEHPKLFVVDKSDNDFFLKNKNLAPENIDIFAYVNTKIVYLEQHLKKEITDLYNNVIQQQCELEKLILHNTLTMAPVSPAEFAFHFMKEPGYIAHLAGEVIRLAKCVPVDVKIRKTTECFQELPITKDNKDYFMLPRTRVIVRTGNQIECTSFLPPMYYINSAWYQILPQVAPVTAPEEIATRTTLSWKYQSPENLASGGLYSDEDVERFRESIMFPIERQAVLNTIARGATGQSINNQGISIDNLIDTNHIRRKLEEAWGKVYSFLNIIGTWSTTLLGAWVVVKTIKFVVDTVMHAVALHSLFGWSLWILGAFWDSFTNILLHIKKQRNEKHNNFINPNDIEIQIDDKQSHNNPMIQQSVVLAKNGEIKTDNAKTKRTTSEPFLPIRTISP